MPNDYEELRTALYEQWWYNHSEHCTNAWPHKGECFWPLHRLLKDAPEPDFEKFDKFYFVREEDHA